MAATAVSTAALMLVLLTAVTELPVLAATPAPMSLAPLVRVPALLVSVPVLVPGPALVAGGAAEEVAEGAVPGAGWAGGAAGEVVEGAVATAPLPPMAVSE